MKIIVNREPTAKLANVTTGELFIYNKQVYMRTTPPNDNIAKRWPIRGVCLNDGRVVRFSSEDEKKIDKISKAELTCFIEDN